MVPQARDFAVQISVHDWPHVALIALQALVSLVRRLAYHNANLVSIMLNKTPRPEIHLACCNWIIHYTYFPPTVRLNIQCLLTAGSKTVFAASATHSDPLSLRITVRSELPINP